MTHRIDMGFYVHPDSLDSFHKLIPFGQGRVHFDTTLEPGRVVAVGWPYRDMLTKAIRRRDGNAQPEGARIAGPSPEEVANRITQQALAEAKRR